MSFQQKFDMCFQGVVNDEVPEDTDEFDLSQMPYRLVFKNISGYQEYCCFCGQNRCAGCPIPYTDMLTIE